MGAVHKAFDPLLNRTVSIRTIDAGAQVDRAAFKGKFLREVRLVAKLNHPNIAAVHDFGESENRLFIVMDYVEGEPLRDYLRSRRLTLEQKIHLSLTVIDAVQYMHSKGVIHGELNPGTIMLGADGKPIVIHYGGAVSTEDSGKHRGARVSRSSIPYQSPEQARGAFGAVDERSDIYGLGMTLYELFTEKTPFGRFTKEQDLRAAVLNEMPMPPSSFDPNLPKEIELIILKCVAKDKADRYPTGCCI
ncbi:MAG: hypothetical protein A3G34_16210 [Candidatus Lindowbacteria bacterium RIFCSPLOWO2_12_FULL_62_27]|nr:MAG: hypothetical protein A3I06_17030 [Candidatus Lindowbacteria bacterium RIFCSPLOWO2_02_FULL_62_12]OGH59895.1 MAG: hypothetical protein A3G34_16210 [Candidatus Lindowbacteria bacterium RIFCSPLOWO2_12_FULL_62_27]